MNTAFSLSIIAGLAALSALNGCESADNSSKPQSPSSLSSVAEAAKAISGQWDLQSLQGTPISNMLRSSGKAPNISISPDGKVSGFGGVNRLTSSLDMSALGKGQFKLAPIASTRMAGSPESMKLEDDFTRLLGQATGFDVSGSTLTLKGAAGTLMQFAKSGGR